MGVYPLLKDETCWFLAIDFDKSCWQDDIGAFSAHEWHKFTDDAGSPCSTPAARACGGGDPIIQVQTVEPPR